MAMRTDMAPYDNNDLRLALKYAVDREQLVKIMLSGYGTVGNDHPLLTQKYTAKDLPQRQYDPDKAKYHLKKAGMEGQTFTLNSSDMGGMMDMALLYKESAKKAGININVVKEPEDGYWSNVWLKKPFITCWWGGRPTADTMLSVAYSGDAPWNDTKFRHARFDELLKIARVELDETKRAQMYKECQQILKDEGGTIIPFFKVYVEGAQKNVKFGKLSGLWEADGHRASERWWFA
jgi:peptide/nickel transport system substrate-binding protein